MLMRVRIQMRTITDPEGNLLGAAGGRRETDGRGNGKSTKSNTCNVPALYALSSLVLHLITFTNYTPSWQACVTTSKRAKFSVDLVVIHDD